MKFEVDIEMIGYGRKGIDFVRDLSSSLKSTIIKARRSTAAFLSF